MSEPKPIPAKNRGDAIMAVGAAMIALSIVLPMIDIAMGETLNLILTFGGLGFAVVGFLVRSRLRRKESG